VTHVASAQAAPSDGWPTPEPPTDHLSLFNLPEFHALTLKEGQQRLQLDYVADDRLIGSLVGVVTGDEFASGFSAPFGGVDLVRESESLPRIIDLVEDACVRLGDRGLRTVRVHAPPPIYSRAETHVQFALLSHGFAVEATELNQHLDLTGLESIETYVERLGRRGRRDLRLSWSQGLVHREDVESGQRAEAYEILKANREAKGRPMRLSFGYLEGLRTALPGRIRWFSLLTGGRTCAAAVTYLVRPSEWLLVYWGDSGHHLADSPMNLLAFKLVEAALAERIELLDLGISSAYGTLNPGLAQFKEKVGAQSSLRFDFVRRLEP
jgi:Acetyltransferase (GNAT) domain